MPTFRFDHWLRARRGVKRWLVRRVVAAPHLPVDPAVAERLLERVVVGEARRLERALLREDEPDALGLRVMLAQPRAPGGGVAHDQFGIGTRKFHAGAIFSAGFQSIRGGTHETSGWIQPETFRTPVRRRRDDRRTGDSPARRQLRRSTRTARARTFAKAVRQKTENPAVHHDISPPLRDIAPAPLPHTLKKNKEPNRARRRPSRAARIRSSRRGRAPQPRRRSASASRASARASPARRARSPYDSAPPDPNGAVGPNQFVEIVNTAFAVFNKSGTPIYGPVATNTLWSGFGGGCETQQRRRRDRRRTTGSPTAGSSASSRSARRRTSSASPSRRPATRPARTPLRVPVLELPRLPEARRLAGRVLHDVQHVQRGRHVVPRAAGCARTTGRRCSPARRRRSSASSSRARFGGLLPSDLDGPTPPPAGAPNFLLELRHRTRCSLWKFHVDWTTPANSTLTGPTNDPGRRVLARVRGGGTCIPQSGTTQKLDSLADRLMYRLAYRNFGDHESLVVEPQGHRRQLRPACAGTSCAARTARPTVFQQGTYAPDATLPLDGLDRDGPARATSRSATACRARRLHPAIRYTGPARRRRARDDARARARSSPAAARRPASLQPLGRLHEHERSTRSTTARSGTRTSTSPRTATFNWSTRIGSFKFAGCSTGPSDFSISASPTSLTVGQAGSGTSTISTAVTSGGSQSVSLSASGQPSGTR